jgi:thiol-disulfide isomerase/thioredoxin
MRLASALLLLAGACLAGCGASGDPAARASQPVTAPQAEQIEWFEGSVDEAFAHAKALGKPLFLYWGAAWCPPCHYIHAVIFADPAFIERSRLFVPVQLDGDTEDAQELGERLGVFGYPTMIVYDATGREITRIPGGIDMAAYANVLDVALAAARPVADIVASVLDQGASLSGSDCELAAYYSWDQDNERVLAERDAAELFGRLRSACPAAAKKPRARLYLERLGALVATARDDGQALTPAQQVEARRELGAILADYALARDNVYFMFFSGADSLGAITARGSEERARLEAAYLDVLEQMQRDESLYPSLRLYTVIGKVKVAKLDAGADAPVPQALQDETERLVAWADARTTDPDERQVVMNAAWGALIEAGLDSQANAMLTREISKASQPHYFMSGLAELAQKAGHYDEAIEWRARAYRAAEGQATRFQWGTDYVVGLIEMTPDDAGAIEQAATELFGELRRSAATAFYHRNVLRMDRLARALSDWNRDGRHTASIERIRAAERSICGSIDAGLESRHHCEAFLAEA